MSKKRLVVIGGGAAGFFCAVNAAGGADDLEVIIVEKTSKVLSKVRISGGGRCNVTHDCNSVPAMLKNYPRGAAFLKKAFGKFFTTDTIRWFEERGVNLKTEKDGRMFPVTDSSQTIIDCLWAESQKMGVQLRLNREVIEIEPIDRGWMVKFAGGDAVKADYVCIACGGYPRTTMFNWLKALGHSIEEPLPSLFTFNIPQNSITRLMGISLEKARVKIKGSRLQEEAALLITHWGMSGPSILRLSAWGARELASSSSGNPGYHFTLIVNWVPAFNENSLQEYFRQLRTERAAQKLVNKNPFHLPQRLWEYLLAICGIDPDLRWAYLPAKQQNLLIKYLCSHEFEVKGKTTFKEEFVTAGGIKLAEIDPSNMMSRLYNNLFFAGEILDVDGVTGGFNFQHAWTSGWIAAQAIKRAAGS